MKTLTYLWLLIGIVFTLQSCDKDETKTVLLDEQSRTSAVLAVSSSTIVLSKEVAEQTMLQIRLSPASFGYQAAISNTLQFAVKGSNFAEVKEVIIPNGQDSLDFTGYNLNTQVLALNVPTGEPTAIEVRIKSSISGSIAPVYSTPVSLEITPYAAVSYLYVPGAYQDWVIEVAESLISPTSNSIYTGIIYFPEADSEFKITPLRDWTQSYGDAGDNKIILNGGGNIKAPRAGNLELTVNTNNNTIAYADHSWGVIGDATPGGWGADTDMRYDNANQVWKVTVDFVVGNFKFRKNHDWGTNLGGANGTLSAGGADIAVSQAGTYDIVLDVTNNTYTLVKK